MRAARPLAVPGLTLLLACARPAPSTPPPPPRVASTGALETEARTSGLGIAHCASGAVMLTTVGARELTPDETYDFLKAHRPPPDFQFLTPGIDSSGFGGCGCGAATPGGCIVVDLWEDSPAVKNLPRLLAQVAASELPDARLRVAISLLPLPVPRCSDENASCGPLPYEHATRAHPPGHRRRLAPPTAGGACRHDGECTIACDCTRFDSRARLCDALYRTDLRDAWCGCLDGGCAWFH